MEACGSICVNETYDDFMLQCLYCPTEIEISLWKNFVLHLRQDHAVFPIDSEDDTELKSTGIFEETQNSDSQLKNLEFSECFNENYSDCLIIANKDEENEEVPNENNSQVEAHLSSIAYIEEESNWSHGENDGQAEIAETEESSKEEEVESYNRRFYMPTTYFKPSFFRRNPRTLEFIQMYRARPCLWHPQHKYYKDEETREAAYKSMLHDMNLNLLITLNKKGLKTAIQQLHNLYFRFDDVFKDGTTKVNSSIIRHFNKCGFLSVVEKGEDDQFDQGSIKLTFTDVNQFTINFIDLYSTFPHLYDRDHNDFTNMIARKQAYETIAQEIAMSGVDATHDDVYKALHYIRQWYNKVLKHLNTPLQKTLSRAELFYINKCSFLPVGSLRHLLPCDICTKTFYSDHALQSHMFKEHGIGELPYVCSFCIRRFDNRADMNIHKQRAHVGKTLKCRFCEMNFATSSEVKLHERTHTGEKPFICDFCGKPFRSKFQLQYHINAIHTKVRPHSCDRCPKTFFKKQLLVDHIKTHLNIRDKKCEICGKAFSNCHSLIRHRKTHTTEKKQKIKKNISLI